MKNVATSIFQVAATAWVCCIAIHSARGQTIAQNITLQPGWNAVWLEVQPTANRTDTVFSDLPVASVWTRAERLSSVEFIQDPSEEAFNQAGWLGWFHPSRPDAFLGNLFAVHANRAYLIKVTNSTPVNWIVVGRPSLRRLSWVPDSYNLRGLPVDPLSLPTFRDFLRHSRAHYDAASGQLQRIYRLNSASGQWQQVGPTDTVQSGAAYWFYTRGASDYLAPLEADVDFSDSLEFGSHLTHLNLSLGNRSTTVASASLRDVANPATSILSYYQFTPAVGGQWPALPNPLTVAVAVESKTRLRLGARRQHLAGSAYESVIEVRDGAGTRLLVPLLVQKPASTAAAAASVSSAATSPAPLAGLWVGAVTLDAVSEAHSANPTNPTPTKSQLSLRLIVHVDAGGQARLLKEIIQMWRNGTYTNNASGEQVSETPGRYVLLSDDTLVPFFNGAVMRDGQAVGRRISSIGYDFPAASSNNFLNLSGTFAMGQSLNATITLPYDHPTNPFKHKFHPDHDNLNVRFDGAAIESYAATRLIGLDFSASPPAGSTVPDFGYNEMGGSYRETITGIHKNPIHIRGTFRLARVSSVADLNPSPTP